MMKIKFFLVLVLLILTACMPDINDIDKETHQKDFFLEWKFYHLDCFGPQNMCNRVYLNNQDFHLFIYNGPDMTLDLKGKIDPLKVPQIKNILSQLAEKKEIIQNTPSCGDKNAGVYNLTFYLDKEYSFTKFYCVNSLKEAPWFNQITYLEHLFHLEALQFGIPLDSGNIIEE